MATKVCPLCGRTYGLTMTMCPVDGRMLADDAAPTGGSASKAVRLSTATEQLLGNILDTEREDSRRHSRDDNAQTLIGPPPGMEAEEEPESDEFSVTETTVSTAYVQGREVTLSKPVAQLKPAASLSDVGASRARVRAPARPPTPVGSTPPMTPRGRDVFSDLHMEFGQMAADVPDDAPTRRVERRDAAGPLRAELPPDSGDGPKVTVEPGLVESLDSSLLIHSEDTLVGVDRQSVLRQGAQLATKSNAADATRAVIHRIEVDVDDQEERRMWWVLILILVVVAIFAWILALM